MSKISTFGSFTQARLGIYAAQAGLTVTGNNISNINTPGYTRQVVDQVSIYASAADRYQQKLDIRIGNGALVTGLSQIRDPYLDIRYRSEASKVGFMNTKLEGLDSIAHILDEVGAGDDENGIIGAQFSELLKTIQNLSSQTGQEEYDTQVRSAAASLVSLFNSTASSLQEVHDNALAQFQQNLTTVNKTLLNIRSLNEDIRKSNLHGDPALELKDERNRLIDELSEYVKINVSYSEEDIGAGMKVEKLTIRLGDANPDGTAPDTDCSILVDGLYATQFELPETVPQINPSYDPNGNPPVTEMYLDAAGQPTSDKDQANQVPNDNLLMKLSKLVDKKDRELLDKKTGDPVQPPVDLDDNDLYGSFQASRELLTEAGEFTPKGTINAIDEKAASKRGVPYYQKALDLLANKLANVFNEANNGYMVDENGDYLNMTTNKPITIDIPDPAGTGTISTRLNKYKELSPEQQTALGGQSLEDYLEANGAKKPDRAGNLFSNSNAGNDGSNITASNISISFDWFNGGVHMVPSYVKASHLDATGSTDDENILHFRALLEASLKFSPNEIDPDASEVPMFIGNMASFLNNVESVMGNDQRSTQIELNTTYSTAVSLDTSRDSVSGVDLNDEAVNMMQYQKAYSAACRLLTAMDEVLERLINNTGVVGR